MEIKPEVETFAKIKVVGVGGAGGSSLNQMIQSGIRGVEFIAVNTDAQALKNNMATVKIPIGKNITRGLGAGMNPELGKKAAEENREDIANALKDADMVFITAGFGGGTGSGASHVIANVARELGALTIGVVTKPFTFEGTQRKIIGDKAHDEIIEKVDTIITIPNDRILQIIDKKTPLIEALAVVDDVLRHAVQGVAELVTVHGYTNVDFADVKYIMKGAGSALMGIGFGKGENRAVEAAKSAIESPLLETSIDGATGILFTITGGKDLGMYELNDAASIITENAAPDAKIIYGTVLDESLKDEIKITVVATGFGRKPENKIRPISQGNSKISSSSMMNHSTTSSSSYGSAKPKAGDFLGGLRNFKTNTSKDETSTTQTDAEPKISQNTNNGVKKHFKNFLQNNTSSKPLESENEKRDVANNTSNDLDQDDLEIPALLEEKCHK